MAPELGVIGDPFERGGESVGAAFEVGLVGWLEWRGFGFVGQDGEEADDPEVEEGDDGDGHRVFLPAVPCLPLGRGLAEGGRGFWGRGGGLRDANLTGEEIPVRLPLDGTDGLQ